jgi:Rrf2 family protein
MIRLSKKIEYAILAMQYIALNDGKQVSAKELSDKLGISYEFLSKTLQLLYKRGLVNSIQGIYGGYTLSKRADNTSLEEIITAIDGVKPSILKCLSEDDVSDCSRASVCAIRSPMLNIQDSMRGIFSSTTIADLNNNITLDTYNVTENQSTI